MSGVVHAIPAPEVLLPGGTTNVTGTDSTGGTPTTPIIAVATDFRAACVSIIASSAGNAYNNVGNGKPASTKHIREGIDYLKTVPGAPAELDFPACGRVSCSYGSAIYWCNEMTDRGLQLSSYANISAGAETIIDRCANDDGVMGESVSGWSTTGPEKDSPHTEWTVIVTGDDC